MSYRVVTRDKLPKVNVVFVGEDDVERVIASKKEFDKQRKAKTGERKIPKKSVKRKLITEESDNVEIKRLKLNDSDDIELALAALEGDGVVEAETSSKPSSLFSLKEDVSAKEMFNFVQPEPEILDPELRKIAEELEGTFEEEVVETVASSSNEVDPLSLTENIEPVEEVVVETTTEINVSEKDVPKTPSTRLKRDVLNGNTPHSLRKRYVKDIRKIQRILEDGEDDDEDDDDFSDSGSEFDPSCTSSEDEGKKSKKKSAKKTEESQIEAVKLSQDRIEEIFQNIKVNESHESAMKSLVKEYTALFDKWQFTLDQNYNILVYGLGSKKEILTQFSKRYHNLYPVIVVNGYFPNLSVKEIVDRICAILKINTTQNIHEMIDAIEKELKEIKILIVINNIDGLMLRSRKTQVLLSRLAKIGNIHMIASVDHINAPLVWDQSMLSDFNWMWCDCTTFFSYTEETNFESNILLQNSKTLTLSSLRNVFQSLPKNSKLIFLIVLNYQLENFSKTYVGITFKDLYKECRKDLLVTSDIGLRSQLKEFLDHCILKLRKTGDGAECYYISIDNQILKQFSEEQVS